MLPSVNSQFSSSVSYTSYQSRSESYSSSKLDQNPISTNRSEESDQVDESVKVDRAASFNVDALVEQIWGFASNRISQAKSEGASDEQLESLWKAAEKGVKQGFSEAKDVLESMDELEEPLALKIDSAYGQILDKMDAREIELGKATIQDAPVQTKTSESNVPNRAINLYQYERQTFALNLTTAQGDEILIRSVAEQESTVEDLKFGRLSSTNWGSTESSGFSLVIKGDLNSQEQEDLDALLAEVNELATEFYEGDYNTAFEMAQDLNINGTSLKSMDLSMKEVEQKGASVYAETSGQTAKVPRGLEPLRNYADKLMAAQERWEERFNAPKDFLETLSNHPMNNGAMGYAAKMLMA